MIVNKNTMVSIGFLITLFPAGAWLINLYADSRVMATEITQLQKDQAIIKSKLDDITLKLTTIIALVKSKHHKNKSM